MNIEEYKNADWVKVSSGNWSFLSCTDYINLFTKDVLVGGKNVLGHVIGVYSKGRNDFWCMQTEKDAAGAYLLKIFNSSEKIKKLCDDMKKQSDSVFSFFDLYKKASFDRALYKTLQQHIRGHYQYHFPIKYISDYLSPKQRIEHLPLIQEARLYAEPVFEKTEQLIRNIIIQISEKTSISKDLISCISREEIIVYFENNKLPSFKELERRNIKTVMWSDLSGYGFLFDEDASEIEKILFKQDSSEIKGQIGYKGVTQGTARVISSPEKYREFNDGDVLVVGMTRPDYIPLIKKSGAIVTDAGGILSHAAIISREFKIPCVIGTNIATKVLKDGDLVEVDANIGVVKILKRNV